MAGPREDPLDAMTRAYHEALPRIVGTLRQIRAESITRPADPNAKPVTGQQFLDDYMAFKQDPLVRASRFAQIAQQEGLTAGQIPRRLAVDYVLEGERRIRERERAEFDRLLEEGNDASTGPETPD